MNLSISIYLVIILAIFGFTVIFKITRSIKHSVSTFCFILVILSVFAKGYTLMNKLKSLSCIAAFPESIASQYKAALEEKDISKLDALLTKHPELIKYKDKMNRNIIDYGMAACDVDIIKLGLEYGETFDNKDVFSCSSFFYDFVNNPYSNDIVNGETTAKMIDTVEFMLDNGADMVHGQSDVRPSFIYDAMFWIIEDCIISKNDMELIFCIINHGCSMDVQNFKGLTPVAFFKTILSRNDVTVNKDALGLVQKFSDMYIE